MDFKCFFIIYNTIYFYQPFKHKIKFEPKNVPLIAQDSLQETQYIHFDKINYHNKKGITKWNNLVTINFRLLVHSQEYRLTQN